VSGSILTETDRDDLNERLDSRLGRDLQEQIARERYYGYIAYTRARDRLVLACSEQDGAGQTLNPSPFIAHVQHLFPSLQAEQFSGTPDWRGARHVSELVAPLLRGEIAGAGRLETLPEVVLVLDRWRRWQTLPGPEQLALSAAAVEALYGGELRTSVSALETFAACPFQFFARYGLRADERELFEADPRQTGSFQHEILSRFHRELAGAGKRWRDLTPQQAREVIVRIGAKTTERFGGGLFQADAPVRFLARLLVEQLQNFIAAAIGWMKQYEFDPHQVELSFGLGADGLSAWKLDLGQDRVLLLRGKIDRVDLCREPSGDAALAVVLDYKSGGAKLDPILLHYGLELQLLSYLGVLRRLDDPRGIFGVSRLVPAGVFYIPLRARAASGNTRLGVLDESKDTVRTDYQHTGRFDATALAKLDNRGQSKGTQFKFAINQNGEFSKTRNEAMPSGEFRQLLDANEEHLRRHTSAIFEGTAAAKPYRKGNERACDWCPCQTVCRFDGWVNLFNVLRKPPKLEETAAASPKKKRGKA
jgi:ATP-dependent helicase/nuclease subunit B